MENGGKEGRENAIKLEERKRKPRVKNAIMFVAKDFFISDYSIRASEKKR